MLGLHSSQVCILWLYSYTLRMNHSLTSAALCLFIKPTTVVASAITIPFGFCSWVVFWTSSTFGCLKVTRWSSMSSSILLSKNSFVFVSFCHSLTIFISRYKESCVSAILRSFPCSVHSVYKSSNKRYTRAYWERGEVMCSSVWKSSICPIYLFVLDKNKIQIKR